MIDFANILKRNFRQVSRLLPLAVLLAMLSTTILPIPTAYAATFDVNDAGDAGDVAPGDGVCDSDEVTPGPQCTLRAAIEEANALAGPDTINLTVPGPYQLTAGVLTVTGEIILNGNGETISGGGLSRIFLVETGGNLSLNNVTLRDGVGDEGGAIHTLPGSTLNILNSAIVNNAATNTSSSSGGGINNWGGTVNIANSTISGNRANAGGGGIANLTAIQSGFIYGTVNLTNVTITDNIADFDGSGDDSHDGGGIYTFGMLNIKNTIIAGNFDNTPAPGTIHPDCANWHELTTQQHNFIGDNTGCDAESSPGDPSSYFPPGTPNVNNDFVGTSDSPLDPLLGDLTGNPAYHPLLAGSLAIDFIPAASATFISSDDNPLFADGDPITTDQIGTSRPQGAAYDIGAVEATTVIYVDLGITKSVTPTTSVAPGQSITYTLHFSNTGEGVATGVVITDIVPITLTNVSVISSGVAITDSGVSPGFAWNVEDLSQNEGGVITISGQINPDLTEATSFTNTATIAAVEPDSDVDDNESAVSVTVVPQEFAWRDVCVLQRMEITGIGMGDRYYTINPQTTTLADPDEVNWLLAQVAGRYAFDAPTPDQVTITTDAPQSLTLNRPTHDSPHHGYTFETSLQPTAQITASVTNPGDGYKTPRGLILYGKRAMTNTWTSVGKTIDEFVYRRWIEAHTEVLTFPPLEEATDLLVTAVVIDNDDDTRPMVLEATAGGVTESVTETGPTDGDGLNVVNLTLSQVPAGTDQVSITLRSPPDNGDSLVWVGLNVGFPCAGPAEADLSVDPSPATVPLGATSLLTITVTPGRAEVSGVQIHGRVDPTYLRLIDVQPTGVLPVEFDPVTFDPVTGEFRYGAELLDSLITEPFAALVLEVQAVATTTGTLVEFLDEPPPTDVIGPEGSVLGQAQDGLVVVTPASVVWGTVNLQGRPVKPAPSWAIPLTVWLTSAGGDTPVYTSTVTTNQYGEFVLNLGDTAPGLYDVRLKGSHTLRNLAPDVSLGSGDDRYFFGTLLEGDVETVTTFNQVLQPDADVLIGSFDLCLGQSGFVANADLDESGCVLLPDFGLLSGNFGLESDVTVTPTVGLGSGSLRASGDGALMAFDAEEMAVAVNEVATVTLDVDPRGQPVNGAMVHLSFDPSLVEVVAVTLTDRLPLVLTEPLIDNQQGVVRFASGILGQTITEKFSVATLSLRVKTVTTGTAIIPVDVFTTTDVSGPEGSVLAEARGITLRVTTQGPTATTIFLPVVVK